MKILILALTCFMVGIGTFWISCGSSGTSKSNLTQPSATPATVDMSRDPSRQEAIDAFRQFWQSATTQDIEQSRKYYDRLPNEVWRPCPRPDSVVRENNDPDTPAASANGLIQSDTYLVLVSDFVKNIKNAKGRLQEVDITRMNDKEAAGTFRYTWAKNSDGLGVKVGMYLYKFPDGWKVASVNDIDSIDAHFGHPGYSCSKD